MCTKLRNSCLLLNLMDRLTDCQQAPSPVRYAELSYTHRRVPLRLHAQSNHIARGLILPLARCSRGSMMIGGSGQELQLGHHRSLGEHVPAGGGQAQGQSRAHSHLGYRSGGI